MWRDCWVQLWKQEDQWIDCVNPSPVRSPVGIRCVRDSLRGTPGRAQGEGPEKTLKAFRLQCRPDPGKGRNGAGRLHGAVWNYSVILWKFGKATGSPWAKVTYERNPPFPRNGLGPVFPTGQKLEAVCGECGSLWTHWWMGPPIKYPSTLGALRSIFSWPSQRLCHNPGKRENGGLG